MICAPFEKLQVAKGSRGSVPNEAWGIHRMSRLITSLGRLGQELQATGRPEENNWGTWELEGQKGTDDIILYRSGCDLPYS